MAGQPLMKEMRAIPLAQRRWERRARIEPYLIPDDPNYWNTKRSQRPLKELTEKRIRELGIDVDAIPLTPTLKLPPGQTVFDPEHPVVTDITGVRLIEPPSIFYRFRFCNPQNCPLVWEDDGADELTQPNGRHAVVVDVPAFPPPIRAARPNVPFRTLSGQTIYVTPEQAQFLHMMRGVNAMRFGPGESAAEQLLGKLKRSKAGHQREAVAL